MSTNLTPAPSTGPEAADLEPVERLDEFCDFAGLRALVPAEHSPLVEEAACGRLETRRAEKQSQSMPTVQEARQGGSPLVEEAACGRLETRRAEKQSQSAQTAEGQRVASTVPCAAPQPARPSDQELTGGFWASINPFGIEGPKLPLIVLALSSALGGWSSAALGIAAPEIQATFGVSVVALTLIGSINSTVLTVIGIPLGYLVDRVNRVRLVQIANFASPIGDMISATAGGYGTFLAGNSLGAVAGTPASGADLPLLADWYPSRSRARVFAFLGIAGTVGGLIATPIVGALITWQGWRVTTMVLGVMSLIVAGLTMLLREPARGRMDRLELTGSEERMEDEPPAPSFSEALRGAWAIKTLRLQAIGGFVNTFAMPLNVILSLILASKFALSPFERSLLASLTMISSIPATMVGSAVADKLMAKKPSSVVALQAAIGAVASVIMVAQAFAPNLWIFATLSVLGTVIPAVLDPIGNTIMSMVVPARYRGVGMQVFTPFALVGTMMGPALLAVSGQVNLQQAFLFFAPFMLISSLIMLASAGSVTGDIRAARAAAIAERDAAGVPDPEAGELLLVGRDLEVMIGGATVLASVDLDVRRGEIVALTGTNGAGKSTLLKALCGLQPSTNGAVFYAGLDITHVPAHQLVAKGVVYIPGGQTVLPGVTVAEHLAIAATHAYESDRVVGNEQGLDEVLDLFPALKARLDTRAENLSGGEQQMLALAQGFLLKPELLLIDELSLGLAPAVVSELLDTVRALNAKGVTIVLVEQSLNIAARIADRIVFMDDGAVAFVGTAAELSDRPDLIRSRFLGRAASARLRGRSRVSATSSTVADSATESARPDVVLQGEDITVEYGGVRALDGVSIDVAPGEVVGLLGSNGAGKTTLFDVLSGYQQAVRGAVRLEGRDVSALSPDGRARLGLARAFQNARLFGPLTVHETVAVSLEKRAPKNVLAAALWLPGNRRDEARLKERVDSLLDVFGLVDYADKPISTLSTGTRRAVEVACQLAMEPKVLLLDEPASGLSQAEVEGLGPALQRIVRDTGCGIVIIEHDLPLLQAISDRLVAMDGGRVIAAGQPDDVLNHSSVRSGYLSASAEVLARSGANLSSSLQEIREPS